jgi:hypothetical protein
MLFKLNDYWEKIKPLSIISNGLDPGFKIDLMKNQIYVSVNFTDTLTQIVNLQSSSTQEI